MKYDIVTGVGAVVGGTTGIVVEYGSLLVVDPGLLLVGGIGSSVALLRYRKHTLSNKVSGFVIGLLLANFSSMGVSEFALTQGFTFINPFVAAMVFGLSGSSIIELLEKWLKDKKDA